MTTGADRKQTKMMKVVKGMIDLNADLGEGFGAYTIGADARLIPCISSANIACGWHAGDPTVMERTVMLAKENGTAVGAHPGFPDLLGFGRRNMTISPDEARCYVKYQIGALLAFAKGEGVPLQHVKPHGALYNMAYRDGTLAQAVCEGIAQVDRELIVLAPSGSCLLKAAEQLGLPTAGEVFADRAYNDDGALVPRGMPGAMIRDPEQAVQRVVQMAEQGTVESINGRQIPVAAQSVCIHGDSPGALDLAQKIRSALQEHGIRIAALREFI